MNEGSYGSQLKRLNTSIVNINLRYRMRMSIKPERERKTTVSWRYEKIQNLAIIKSNSGGMEETSGMSLESLESYQILRAWNLAVM